MRAVLSALVFPTVFGGALTVTWALLHADVARPLVVALVMAAAALAVKCSSTKGPRCVPCSSRSLAQ